LPKTRNIFFGTIKPHVQLLLTFLKDQSVSVSAVMQKPFFLFPANAEVIFFSQAIVQNVNNPVHL
jgi:hypothetical protein